MTYKLACMHKPFVRTSLFMHIGNIFGDHAPGYPASIKILPAWQYPSELDFPLPATQLNYALRMALHFRLFLSGYWSLFNFTRQLQCC